MRIKIHDSYRKIVALADSELIGKTFSEGIKQIHLSENFYSGEEKTLDEIIPLLIDLEKEDATFNIVGKESINAALEAKIISKEGIITIENIPIALGLF